MLLDIFSSFDPHTHQIYTSLRPTVLWCISTLPILLIHARFWIQPNRFFWAYALTIKIIITQAIRRVGNRLKGFRETITRLFIIILIINISGLLPYTFRSTRHLLTTFSLGLPLWLSLIISSATNAPKEFTAHLLPAGAPRWLNPFLILVETIRLSTRPITLSFRLAANMRAGHIVLTLIGTFSSARGIPITLPLLLIISTQLIYTLFEIGICLIQAYIFCLLLTLYADEHTK